MPHEREGLLLGLWEVSRFYSTGIHVPPAALKGSSSLQIFPSTSVSVLLRHGFSQVMGDLPVTFIRTFLIVCDYGQFFMFVVHLAIFISMDSVHILPHF